MSFPNQKMYHIKKKVEEGDVFLMLKWEDCVKAGRELKGAAFNLYLYLAKNKDGYNLHFSTEDFMQTYGVSEKTYRNARDKLFEKGYLKEGRKIMFTLMPRAVLKIQERGLENKFNLFMRG